MCTQSFRLALDRHDCASVVATQIPRLVVLMMALLLVLGLAIPAPAAEIGSMTYTVPEGFRAYSAFVGYDPNWQVSVYLRNLGPSDEPTGKDVLGIDIGFWRGPRPVGWFDENLYDRGINHRVIQLEWSGLELQAMRSESPEWDDTIIAYTFDVPLAEDAARIWVWGPASRLDELDAALDELVDSIDGESNWPGQRRTRSDAVASQEEPEPFEEDGSIGSRYNTPPGKPPGMIAGLPREVAIFGIVLLLLGLYVVVRIIVSIRR